MADTALGRQLAALFATTTHHRDAVVEASPRWTTVTTASARTPHRNLLLSADLGPDVDADIRTIRRHFAATGVPARWWIGAWCRPTDLADRLAAAGLVEETPVEGMELALDGTWSPPTGWAPPPGAGPEVVPVDGPLVADYLGVLQEGLGLPAEPLARIRGDLERHLAGALGRTFAQALVDGQPVGAGSARMVGDGHGHLDGSVVLPAHRGRGAYRALVAHRVAWAAAEGARHVTIHAVRDTAAPICRRLGFRDVGTIRLLLDDAGT